ncbi:MAG: uracil-DNA glycosylase family protein [Muribaculaceae bacterium]|nr:uracil-DNA glycosylase family protein [Muribaculaceae bacterium]
MDFFYPNFYNDMWRIFGMIFYNDREKFFNKEKKRIDKEGIQDMLRLHHIGIGETVKEAIRTQDNAYDKYLEVVKPVNLPELLKKIPECYDVVTTGEKAASVIASLTTTTVPKVGEFVNCECRLDEDTVRKFRHWRMPSTSRAYPMKTEIKAEYYKRMMQTVGII